MQMDSPLKNLLELIKKRIWFIAILTIIAGASSGYASFAMIKPTFETTTSVFVSSPNLNKDSIADFNQVMMYQNLTKTFAEIAASNKISEKTSIKLNGIVSSDQILKSITIVPKVGTQVLTIKGQYTNPDICMKIVNSTAESLIEEATALYPGAVDIKIIDNAKLPILPSKPKKIQNILLAIFISFTLALITCYISEYFDNTVKTKNQIENYIGLPVIGVITDYSKKIR